MEKHRRGKWGMPVGVLFAPTDEQLVATYLRGKIDGGSAGEGLIADHDVYGCDPWELPRQMFNYPRGQLDEMYFFTPRRSANGNGGRRCGRAAGCGVWHGNGKDNLIKAWDEGSGRPVVVGHRTSFKFEMNAAAASSSTGKPKRVKTEWLMHEYRLGSGGDDYRGLALCKIYEKRGKALDQEECDTDDHRDTAPLQQQGRLKRRREEEEPRSQAVAEEAALLPDASSCQPWSPDTPFQFCPGAAEGQTDSTPFLSCPGAAEGQTDSIEEDGRPDPAKRRRAEQPEQPQPQCSMADESGGNPLSPVWSDIDAFTLEEMEALLSSPCSSVPLITEADPTQHWPAFDFDEGLPFDPIRLLPLDDLLPRDLHPMLPSGVCH